MRGEVLSRRVLSQRIEAEKAVGKRRDTSIGGFEFNISVREDRGDAAGSFLYPYLLSIRQFGKDIQTGSIRQNVLKHLLITLQGIRSKTERQVLHSPSSFPDTAGDLILEWGVDITKYSAGQAPFHIYLRLFGRQQSALLWLSNVDLDALISDVRRIMNDMKSTGNLSAREPDKCNQKN